MRRHGCRLFGTVGTAVYVLGCSLINGESTIHTLLFLERVNCEEEFGVLEKRGGTIDSRIDGEFVQVCAVAF